MRIASAIRVTHQTIQNLKKTNGRCGRVGRQGLAALCTSRGAADGGVWGGGGGKGGSGAGGWRGLTMHRRARTSTLRLRSGTTAVGPRACQSVACSKARPCPPISPAPATAPDMPRSPTATPHCTPHGTRGHQSTAPLNSKRSEAVPAIRNGHGTDERDRSKDGPSNRPNQVGRRVVP